jgi:hypothetical protein
MIRSDRAPGPSGQTGRVLLPRESLLGTHYWYQQTHRGLPVLGGYYVRHVDPMGREFLVRDGRLQVGALTSTVTSVPPSRAATAATMRAEGTDKFHGDNSFYIPSQDKISLGAGGVDDAEDAEVT